LPARPRRLINAGLSPVTVASVLGHANPTIALKVYAHRFDRQKRDEDVRAALAF
jgi:integrase